VKRIGSVTSCLQLCLYSVSVILSGSLAAAVG